MVLWVGLAGSAGAVARFVLDGMIRSRRTSEFPWATVVVNVTGSLIQCQRYRAAAANAFGTLALTVLAGAAGLASAGW